MRMVKILRILFLFLSTVYFLFSTAFAQWEPDKRLTYADSASFYRTSYGKHIACDNLGRVHIVWEDLRDPGRRSRGWIRINAEVYYKRSTDAGNTWGPDTRLTFHTFDDTLRAECPSIALDTMNKIHVVWIDFRDNEDTLIWRTNSEVYYKRSTDGGMSWEPDVRLSYSPASTNIPYIAADYLNGVHVFWGDWAGSTFEVFYRRSTDGGTTWEQERILTGLGWDSDNPVATIDENNNIHLAWMYWPFSFIPKEIWYMKSTDRGLNWGDPIRLIYADQGVDIPAIAVDEKNRVHVVFLTSDGWYYRGSTDGGITWSRDTIIEDRKQVSWGNEPSLEVDRKNGVHFVWNENLSGTDTQTVFYKESRDGGMTWEKKMRLSEKVGLTPSITADRRNRVHVVWSDWRDETSRKGNSEIYYKRKLPLGVEEGFELSDKYNGFEINVFPNPMKDWAWIRFRKGGENELGIYDISGREVRVLEERMKDGEVFWDGKDSAGKHVSSGVYFIRLKNKTAQTIKKIVVLR